MAEINGSKREELLPPLSEDDRMLSGLCYAMWFIACPYVLGTKKKKELFLYFHALQGLYYGAAVTAASFLTILLVYVVFFYRSLKKVADPANKLDMQITVSTISVIVLMMILFAMVLLVFFTLWLGWKASSGRIFRLPIIGAKVYSIIDRERTRLEMEYLDSLSKPEEKSPSANADMELSPYPAQTGVSAGAGRDDGTVPYDYQKLLVMNPPVERLKSIFSQPAEPVEIEDGFGESAEEEFVHEEEEQAVSSVVYEEHQYPAFRPAPVSELQGEERHLPRKPQPEQYPAGSAEGPPLYQKPLQNIESRTLSAMEKLQMLREREKESTLRKVQPVRDAVKFQKKMEAPQKPKEPAPGMQDSGRAQSTSFLSPQAHIDILRRKYEQSSMAFRPAKNQQPPIPPEQPAGREQAEKPRFNIEKQRELNSQTRQMDELRQRYASLSGKSSEPIKMRKRTPENVGESFQPKRISPAVNPVNEKPGRKTEFIRFNRDNRREE